MRLDGSSALVERENKMRTKLGVLCMIMGAALVMGALFLFITNEREAQEAGNSVTELLPQLVQEMEKQMQEESEMPTQGIEEVTDVVEEAISDTPAMPVVTLDGEKYIGILSIPALGMEWPVMTDWTYAKLRVSPCRYAGSLDGDDLVIMAHNYKRHFGELSSLSKSDRVLFTDVNGTAIEYEVVAQDLLPPHAVEEMTAGEFDLTLFTCTYSGQSRVTVYCDRVS